MTLYFWMHWFWITSWIFLVFGKSVSTLHSMESSELALSNNSMEHHLKSIGVLKMSPPINISVAPSSDILSNISTQQNISSSKVTKPSVKKVDSIQANVNLKFNTTKVYPNKQTVIYQNVTDISVNITDTQSLITTNFSAAINNHTTDNVTNFNGEELNLNNQSFILNPERIGDNEATETESGSLTAAGITGISLGCVILGIICGGSYILYRNRGFNRPQVLNDRCSNPDSSGYIDDASVRDNSEEMYSLDNDSFLNSLEAMTIQNYWTDTVKHTKL